MEPLHLFVEALLLELLLGLHESLELGDSILLYLLSHLQSLKLVRLHHLQVLDLFRLLHHHG